MGLGIHYDSCRLTDINPHFIPSPIRSTDAISKCKQLSYYDVIDTWASRYILWPHIDRLFGHSFYVCVLIQWCWGHWVEEVVIYFQCLWNVQVWHFFVNTLRPRQNGRHFPDDIFKCISLNENMWISIKVSLNFVTRGPITSTSYAVSPLFATRFAACTEGIWVIFIEPYLI